MFFKLIIFITLTTKNTSSPIGFSWAQIKAQLPDYSPIADVALRLHATGLSEASCERTISQQKLIYTAKRRNTKRDLLDARLKIMSSSYSPNYANLE